MAASTPEQLAIQQHLTYDPGPNPRMRRYSSFTGALRDARGATGRDASGAVIDEERAGNWLGAIGYMALLDQIGRCFQPRGKTPSSTNRIEKALELFADLPKAERQALYALRNAFTHEFSVFNENDDPGLRHVFLLVRGPGFGAVVRLPPVPWDGDWTKEPTDRTVVDPRAFGDLVEDVVHRLSTLAAAGELEIALPGGAAELARRYQLMARDLAPGVVAEENPEPASRRIGYSKITWRGRDRFGVPNWLTPIGFYGAWQESLV